MRKSLTRCWLAAAILIGFSGVVCATESRPNVLVVIADDLGWGDVASHGNTGLQTPHLDRLAGQGASFKRFYVQPVCAPTRAEFFTGRDHRSVGVTGVSQGAERLDPRVPTVADAFRSAGYATGLFGKWHNGTQPPYHPLCRGFDEFYGFTSGHWGHYFDFWLDHNNRMVTGRGYAPNDFTEHAMGFVEANRDRPFFAVVSFNTPHSPMQVPDAWWDRHAAQEISLRATEPDNEDIDHTRAALAMCENLDWNVGRLLQQLDTLQVADETIVVFFSDNGPNGHRWNDLLRGIKGSTDEGGVRSPLFVRWPDRISPKTVVTTPACVLDLPLTLSRLCALEFPESDKLEGIDLSPLLLGPAHDTPHDAARDRVIISHWSERVAARRRQFLLDHQGRLYDLHSDPRQTRDRAAEWPGVVTELASEIEQWRERTGDRGPGDAAPFTVGHASHPVSHLPARDATALGRLQRSNRYSNCSYFFNWSDPDDAIVWDVEVHSPGKYTVTLFVATPANAVGTEVMLRANGAETGVVLHEATNYEPLGPAHDRVPRQEGSVKHFQLVPMGPLQLSPGRQSLRLSITPQQSPGPAIWQLTLEFLDPHQ